MIGSGQETVMVAVRKLVVTSMPVLRRAYVKSPRPAMVSKYEMFLMSGMNAFWKVYLSSKSWTFVAHGMPTPKEVG